MLDIRNDPRGPCTLFALHRRRRRGNYFADLHTTKNLQILELSRLLRHDKPTSITSRQHLSYYRPATRHDNRLHLRRRLSTRHPILCFFPVSLSLSNIPHTSQGLPIETSHTKLILSRHNDNHSNSESTDGQVKLAGDGCGFTLQWQIIHVAREKSYTGH